MYNEWKTQLMSSKYRMRDHSKNKTCSSYFSEQLRDMK